MTKTHWLLVGGFLTATASVIAGLDHWVDLTKPPIIAGLLMQLGTMIGALFASKPSPEEP
jgi:hypothetical protein